MSDRFADGRGVPQRVGSTPARSIDEVFARYAEETPEEVAALAEESADGTDDEDQAVEFFRELVAELPDQVPSAREEGPSSASGSERVDAETLFGTDD